MRWEAAGNEIKKLFKVPPLGIIERCVKGQDERMFRVHLVRDLTSTVITFVPYVCEIALVHLTAPEGVHLLAALKEWTDHAL